MNVVATSVSVVGMLFLSFLQESSKKVNAIKAASGRFMLKVKHLS